MNKIFKTKFRSFNGETCTVAVSEKTSCKCKSSNKGLRLHASIFSLGYALKSLSLAVISALTLGSVFVPSGLNAWTLKNNTDEVDIFGTDTLNIISKDGILTKVSKADKSLTFAFDLGILGNGLSYDIATKKLSSIRDSGKTNIVDYIDYRTKYFNVNSSVTGTGSNYDHTAGVNGATGTDSMTIGLRAKATGMESIAIGKDSYAYKKRDIALGYKAIVDNLTDRDNAGSLSLGSWSYTRGAQAISIGSRTAVLAQQSTAIGNDSVVLGEGGIAIGGDDSGGGDTGPYNKGDMHVKDANGDIVSYDGNKGNLHFREKYRTTISGAQGATAISPHAQALTQGATAIGIGATAGYGTQGVSTGVKVDTMTIYNWIPSDAIETTAVGAKSWAMRGYSAAIGAEARSYATGGVAIGYSAKSGSIDDAVGKGSVAIGSYSEAKSSGSVAIGGRLFDKNNVLISNAISKGTNTVAIGAGAVANDDDSIALGSGSISNRDSYNGNTYDPFVILNLTGDGIPTDPNDPGYATWHSTKAVVSVGKGEVDKNTGEYISTETRQITNVAAGSADTDAVNVAQLKAAQNISTSRFYSVRNKDKTTGNYNNEGAVNTNSVAAGPNALAVGSNSITFGNNAVTTDSTIESSIRADLNSIKLAEDEIAKLKLSDPNYQTKLQAQQKIIDDIRAGFETASYKNDNENSIAIGNSARTNAKSATAIGKGAQALGLNSIAHGTGTKAKQENMVSIGNAAGSLGTTETKPNGLVGMISIGNLAGNNTINNALGINIGAGAGANSNASGGNGIAIGSFAGQNVTGNENVAIAHSAGQNISGYNNLAIMKSAGQNVKGNNNLAIGIYAGGNNTGHGNIAIGQEAARFDKDGNNRSGSSFIDTIALGTKSVVEANNAIAIGKGAQALNKNSISVGTGNIVSGANSGAFGDPNNVTGNASYAFGNNNTIAQENTFVLGNSVTTTQANSVVLGNLSTDREATAETTATVGDLTYSGFKGVGSAANGVVSVGDTDKERQIINVAAGQISSASTDAINGSQLFATNTVLGNVGSSVVNVLGGNAALGSDGTITMGDNIGGTGKKTVDAAIKAARTHYFSVNDNGVKKNNYDNDGAIGIDSIAVGPNAVSQSNGSVV
ncbi:MAG: hypothetical protein GX282_05360, partial [Campylobacteraceae bacterium]|nr:hypothetical protein [Campylobacteraceae bacterium]